MFWILAATLAASLIYLFVLKPLKYWREKNVPQKPILDILQMFISGLIFGKPFAEIVDKLYNEFPQKRYSGAYAPGGSLLILRDIELIKQITVKDFDYFTDHRQFAPSDDEPLWSNNLFSLKGEKWRHMRATLSPSFTSSKMKMMFVLMSQCAEDFVKYFLDNPKMNKEINMVDVLRRYTNDVIATTAFGVKCDSLKNRNNEFYLMGKEATKIFRGTLATFKFMFLLLAPKIAQLFGIRLLSAKAANFFLNLVSRTIKTREEKSIIRPDMIHLLMKARKENSKNDTSCLPDKGFDTVEEQAQIKRVKKDTELTDVDITAQALVFFFGGFDTVSRMMCFNTHEIAVNPDVQTKLQEEIDDALKDCNGKITYEALTKMKYLDMVVSEGLRKWPNAIMYDRVCVKPYTIQPEVLEEKPVHLSKDDKLWVPVFGIHRDPQYYPDPERFDPERFNDENKKNIKPYTYIPFGSGPRNCIGSRFALLEIKILLFHLLSKFDLVPTSKTQNPIKLCKRQINLHPENGFYLGFNRRNLNLKVN